MTQSQDFIVIGAGFAGLYMLHKLKDAGFGAKILEAGQDVGGTWYWNRYPGAHCDVSSLEYQLGFPSFLQEEWSWKQKFAPQAEIQKYLSFVADRLDLRKDIAFGQFVTKAEYRAGSNDWHVETSTGDVHCARFVIFATGCLSRVQFPDIPGLDAFRGRKIHTGDWPADGLDVKGQRVAVIGTGSSGVQVIPELARDAAQLHVLQRTPNYVLPVENKSIDENELSSRRASFPQDREIAHNSPAGVLTRMPLDRSDPAVTPEVIEKELEERWLSGNAFDFLGTFADVFANLDSNAIVADFFRRKVAQLVGDAELAQKLTPTHYPIGAKRMCLGMHYYDAFTRPNVELIDISKVGIDRITENSIWIDGREIEVDTIVFATGFDAITGSLNRIDVRSDGKSLREMWAGGAKSYLGILVAGLPNLFLITGPNSPSVFGNVIVAIEQHVDWIADCARWMRERGYDSLSISNDAQERWAEIVNDISRNLIFSTANARSWYMGDNVPGKPRQFLPYAGGFGAFRAICTEIAAAGYPEISFSAHSSATEKLSETSEA